MAHACVPSSGRGGCRQRGAERGREESKDRETPGDISIERYRRVHKSHTRPAASAKTKIHISPRSAPMPNTGRHLLSQVRVRSQQSNTSIGTGALLIHGSCLEWRNGACVCTFSGACMHSSAHFRRPDRRPNKQHAVETETFYRIVHNARQENAWRLPAAKPQPGVSPCTISNAPIRYRMPQKACTQQLSAKGVRL